MTENAVPVMSKPIDNRSFTEKILGIPPSEEVLYQSHFKSDLWSLEEFCALMGGLSPERHKAISEHKAENITQVDIKRLADAHKIFKQFLRHFEEVYTTEKMHEVNGDFYMTPWKFIKWIAMHEIPIKERFFDSLPLYLMEIFFEFGSTNTSLRTQPQWSRAYHEAYYLKNAQLVIHASSQRLSRNAIYSHPRMQDVLRQVRQLGGHYTKRTITDIWLAKLEECKRGRPKKNSPQNC